MEKEISSHFKKYLLTNSAIVSFRYVVVAAVGLAVSVAFARLSTKEVFGQYQFILALFSFFAVFSLPGLNLAALKSASRGELGTVSQAVRLSFLASMMAVPLLVGYGAYALLGGRTDELVGWACIIFGSLFPLLNAPNTWYVYYEGRLHFFPVAIRVIGSSVLTALLLFLGLWYQVSILFLVSSWFFTSIFCTWFFYWEVLQEERKNKNEPGRLDVQYGIWVTIQKFVVGLTESIPVLAISFFLSFEAVANFQVAFVFVGAVSGLLGALTAMAFPVIFSNLASKHSKLLLYSVLSGTIASLGYVLFVETIFLFVYGNQYRESFELARLFVGLPFLVALRMYFVNIFTARRENMYIIFSYIVANTVSAILLWLSIRMGVSFAWSTALYVYSLNLQLLSILALRYYRLK